MGNQPLISIIVPVYRVEKYLKKCVDSLINQTYTNIEIILVDDGSPDACAVMCDEFEKNDIRIKVIHKVNGGLSDARNAGLEIAKGDYIAFVDSDDFVAPNMYEVLLSAAECYGADIAICNYVRISDAGKIESMGEYAIDDRYTRYEFIHELIQPYGGYFVVVWNKLYKRCIFDHLTFPVGKQHEDEFVLHYIIDRCSVIASVKNALYYYTQRDESIMSKGVSVKNLDYGDALIDRYYFTKAKKYIDWKNHCVLRLSYEFDKWKGYAERDPRIKRKYEELRRKTAFLGFEKAAWSGYNINWRGKVFMRIEHIFPIFAKFVCKITHKEIH